jgi:hypothetical protein
LNSSLNNSSVAHLLLKAKSREVMEQAQDKNRVMEEELNNLRTKISKLEVRLSSTFDNGASKQRDHID